jgi:multidrug efflux pump subunit AcrA (membrane-fusion protein)
LTFALSKVNFFISMSKRISLFLLLLSALVACKSQGPAAGDALRTVKVTKVQAVGYVDRDFAGMATADDAVNLAFKIAGQVASVDVSKGDYVKKGQLLAQLDPRDVELQVAADKAQYERAESQ